MWNYLKGNENGSVLVFNIKVFLCAIMNYNQPWMNAPQAAEDQQVEEGPKPKKKVNA